MHTPQRFVVYPLSRTRPHPRRNPLPKMLFALVALHLVAGCYRPAPMTEMPSLAVLTNLEGVTEPCGCTSRPLGGIDRIAQVLAAARQKGPVAFVAVGNTFFTEISPKEAMLRHERDKAVAIADILGRLAPASVVTGPIDNGPMRQTLEALPPATKASLHLELAPKAGEPAAPHFVVQQLKLAQLPLALIAAPSPPPTALAAQAQYTQALVAQAKAAREQGASLVLVLWPHGLQAARTSLEGLRHVDFVLTGSASVLLGDAAAAQAPEVVGEATLLQAGARGERLGFLRLHAASDMSRWTFFDGHKAERLALGQRAGRLRQEAAQLPEGPGRTARQKKAQALDDEAASLPDTPPQNAYVSWALEDIDDSHKPEPWASQALAAFNRSLCASAMADTAKRTCPPPATANDAYIGTQSCRACHAQAFEVYEHTRHARAWATLTNAGKECDLSCVGCHVVGFEQPGGFCHLADAASWANVGCESCHGPGAGHAAHPGERALWGAAFERDTPQATCRGCHNQEHSDQFNFETYRPQVLGPGHGAPMP